jgi:hypothetical protein
VFFIGTGRKGQQRDHPSKKKKLQSLVEHTKPVRVACDAGTKEHRESQPIVWDMFSDAQPEEPSPKGLIE